MGALRSGDGGGAKQPAQPHRLLNMEVQNALCL